MATKKKKTNAKATKSKSAMNAVAPYLGDRQLMVNFSKVFFTSKERKNLEAVGRGIARVSSIIDEIFADPGSDYPELRIFLQSYRQVLAVASEMTHSIGNVEVPQASRAVQMRKKK